RPAGNGCLSRADRVERLGKFLGKERRACERLGKFPGKSARKRVLAIPASSESQGHSAESQGHGGHVTPGSQAHVYQDLTTSARSHRATGPRYHTVSLSA